MSCVYVLLSDNALGRVCPAACFVILYRYRRDSLLFQFLSFGARARAVLPSRVKKPRGERARKSGGEQAESGRDG